MDAEQPMVMKYKSLMTDKTMQGYKGWKPDQAHSPTLIGFLNGKEVLFYYSRTMT